MADAPSSPTPDLSVTIGTMTLRNPVITLSGTCGYGDEYAPFLDLDRLGAFTTKSVTLHPRKGNAPPRVVETPAGMLNAIGLANVGLQRFLADKLPALQRFRAPVIVNVAGHTPSDYIQVCEALDAQPGIAAVELNVSCPNVADGLIFGTDACALHDLVAAVRQVVRRAVLIVKLSPNVTDITAGARAAIDAGADALSLVNTFVGMAIDIERRRPVLSNVTGGLSGPAIRPLALHMVHQVYRRVAHDAGVPIIGMGGIASADDAIAFLLAGASAVGVGTALFVDPETPVKILTGMGEYLRRHRIERARDLIGRLEPPSDRPL